MSTTQQPEALVFANDRPSAIDDDLYQWAIDAEDLIRHQHARIAELEAQLSAIAHTAEGATAQTETLRAELAEETEAADNWRRLALQFDNHRMQALGHLKAILHPDSSVDEYKAAELFLKAPPLDGEAVLAQRIAALAAQAKQGECSMTTKKTIAAINAEIPRLEQEMQSPADTHDLMDAVLNCPHSITHESVTLHFYPRQKEGHNALAQLRHRLADYDLAARQREMQLLGEIEALERVALNALKQLEESTHTTKKGMGGNWLTVVYRDIQPGDEAHAIAEHPKVSALSWSHALHDRDAALAAQAKNGDIQP